MVSHAMRVRAASLIAAVLVFLGILLAYAALPDKANAQEPSGQNKFNVMFVLDSSISMRDTDPDGLRYEAIKQFTGLLAEQGNAAGGVVFSNHITTHHRLSPILGQGDKDAVVAALETAEVKGYTNIGEGLTVAIDDLKANSNDGLRNVIVLLSDGNTDMPTGEEIDESVRQKADAIQLAREAEIPIYSVCLNVDGSADVGEMQQISQATNGKNIEVTRADDLQNAFNDFYALIYGMHLPDSEVFTIPESGRLETSISVPRIGVEEVNVLIRGNATGIDVYQPDGSKAEPTIIDSRTFMLVKITNATPGQWTLVTSGVPGEQVEVSLVYNSNLTAQLNIPQADGVIAANEHIDFDAQLVDAGEPVTDSDLYEGYEADLVVLNKDLEEINSVPMALDGSTFKASESFPEGVYNFRMRVKNVQLNRETEITGPYSAIEGQGERTNTPPKPVQEVVTTDIAVWPFQQASYAMDLSTLATDEQDDELDYEIVSTAFIEGEDYTLNGTMLNQDHFSLPKGSYTVRASDVDGLSCDIELIVATHNVALITLIALLVLALIVLAAIGITMYINFGRSIGGEVSIRLEERGLLKSSSSVEGARGRIKLSRFNLDPCGLDYRKSYIMGTKGYQAVILKTNIKVRAGGGMETNRVKIPSGMEQVAWIGSDADAVTLKIKFTSRHKRKGMYTSSGSGRKGGFGLGRGKKPSAGNQQQGYYVPPRQF